MHIKRLISLTLMILLFLTSPIYASDIYAPIVGQVSEGDKAFFLIDVTKEDALTITVSLHQLDLVQTIPDDEITILGIYDPIGNKIDGADCAGEILKSCRIYNPIEGTWLVEVQGDKIYGTGEINVQASYLINSWQVYYNVYELNDYTSLRYDMAEYSMTFFEKYISTSDRNHLGIIGQWNDYAAKYDVSIISPNLKTASDISTEDETSVSTYYLAPGNEAEGKWIVLMRSLKGTESITLYSNYGYFDEVRTQQFIEDEIRKVDEAKEYPIQVTDTSTPLVLSLIEKQSGDSLDISKVFNPSGLGVSCTEFETGCAIQDPEEGIWLVDISASSITGTAPFNFISTHHTYEPKDYTITQNLKANNIIFYETYIKTQDKEHMVAVADWQDSQTNIELGIVSANIVTKTSQSAGDEKNVRLYSLSPGNTAEGKWIVQLASLEGAGDINFSSNYNLTKISTQEIKYIDNIEQDEIQTYLLDVTDTEIPIVISLIEKQSGDNVVVSSITDPDDTTVTCTSFASGCAVKNTMTGVWTVEVKGTSITGVAPYVLATTYGHTYCGNDECQPELGENCKSCASDCACNQFETCSQETSACISITRELPRDNIVQKLKENILKVVMVLLIIIVVGYKIYKNKYSF